MSKRIGILGGAFDPIHFGHLVLAAEASNRLELNLTLFVPTFHTPHQHKEISTSFEDRCAMVGIAIDRYDDWLLSEVEQKIEGTSYTVKTLQKLQAIYPRDDLFFLIGADNLAILDTWYQPEEIVKLATLAVAARPGFSPELPALENVITFDMPLIDIAASNIRERIRTETSIRMLVPPEVEDYIMSKRLYHG